MSSTLVGNPQFLGSTPAPFDPATVEFKANIDQDPAIETVHVSAEFNTDGSLKHYTLTDAETFEPIYGITNGSLEVSGNNGILKVVYHYPNSKQVLISTSQPPVAPATYSGGRSANPSKEGLTPKGSTVQPKEPKLQKDPTMPWDYTPPKGENKGHHRN